MARAIKATPILYNDDAKRFIVKAIRTSKEVATPKALRDVKEGASKLQSIFVAR